MNLKKAALFALTLAGMPVHSQVQLFEADMSGIVPFVGIKWNQGVQEMVGGLEYTIDGRIALGFQGAKPLKDTITADASLKSYIINPYGIFEFVEPDNLKNFSFALRADFVQEFTQKDAATGEDPNKLNSFKRTSMGGGPMFAMRFFSSERFLLIPFAAYELFYVTMQKNILHTPPVQNEFKEDTFVWHEVSGACAFNYKFSEFNGIVFEPRFTAKFGPERAPEDLVNISATIGFVRSF